MTYGLVAGIVPWHTLPGACFAGDLREHFLGASGENSALSYRGSWKTVCFPGHSWAQHEAATTALAAARERSLCQVRA